MALGLAAGYFGGKTDAAIMRSGEIVEIGACERVFGDPQHAYTKELLQAIPLPDVDPDWVNAVQ